VVLDGVQLRWRRRGHNTVGRLSTAQLPAQTLPLAQNFTAVQHPPDEVILGGKVGLQVLQAQHVGERRQRSLVHLRRRQLAADHGDELAAAL
jgi:hypothetical protein